MSASDRRVIRVGVIGLGSIGTTHLDVYSRREDVRVVAVSDRDTERLAGRARVVGNIEGQARGGADLSRARKYADAMELVADPEVELVDVCVWTPLHAELGLAALAAGKHVLIEKPLARTAEEAWNLAHAARGARGLAMCGMCMRFWPGWTWLKEAIESRRYGRVVSASFRRVCEHPGGPFSSSGELSGGALLDLHVHDTDFVQHCFGLPSAVSSHGYSRVTSAIDHVVTRYLYEGPDAPKLVVAEGSWVMSKGFGFRMQYAVAFERATATYELGAPSPLKLFADGREEIVPVDPGLGYEREIAYFLDCIHARTAPTAVTLDDAARSVEIVEAEERSIALGAVIELGRRVDGGPP